MGTTTPPTHGGGLIYCIAGKFGEVFNLAIWQSRKIAKFNSANIKPRGTDWLVLVLQEI